MSQAGENNAALAKAVGVSHVAVGNYVSGRLPRAEELLQIARHFKVSLDYLLGWNEERRRMELEFEALGQAADSLGGTEEEKQQRFVDLVNLTQGVSRSASEKLQRLTKFADEAKEVAGLLQSLLADIRQAEEAMRRVFGVPESQPAKPSSAPDTSTAAHAALVGERPEPRRGASRTGAGKAASPSGNVPAPGAAPRPANNRQPPAPTPARRARGNPVSTAAHPPASSAS